MILNPHQLTVSDLRTRTRADFIVQSVLFTNRSVSRDSECVSLVLVVLESSIVLGNPTPGLSCNSHGQQTQATKLHGKAVPQRITKVPKCKETITNLLRLYIICITLIYIYIYYWYLLLGSHILAGYPSLRP